MKLLLKILKNIYYRFYSWFLNHDNGEELSAASAVTTMLALIFNQFVILVLFFKRGNDSLSFTKGQGFIAISIFYFIFFRPLLRKTKFHLKIAKEFENQTEEEEDKWRLVVVWWFIFVAVEIILFLLLKSIDVVPIYK